MLGVVGWIILIIVGIFAIGIYVVMHIDDIVAGIALLFGGMVILGAGVLVYYALKWTGLLALIQG